MGMLRAGWRQRRPAPAGQAVEKPTPPPPTPWVPEVSLDPVRDRWEARARRGAYWRSTGYTYDTREHAAEAARGLAERLNSDDTAWTPA